MAARWSIPSSNRATVLNSASQSRAALRTIASKTGWTSVGEAEMARRISPVAVCRASVSVSSRLRPPSASTRRAFSTAMTAWSAKVWSSATWRSGKGVTSAPKTTIAPIAAPSWSMGTASARLKPAARMLSVSS